VTSMNPQKGLRHTSRSYQAPPDVRKSYVSVLWCCCDSSGRQHFRLPDTADIVAGKTCGVCESYVPYASKT